MRYLLIGFYVLLGLGLVITACNQPESVTTTQIQYLYDTRTELCFAARFGAYNTASYALVTVPCTPAVRKLTEK